MNDILRSLRPVGQPEDDAAREARHQILATLLGAYADGELPIETASQMDAHLLGCGRCRSELRVQHTIRDRLSHSTLPTATVALQERIRRSIAATPIVEPAIELLPSSATARHRWKFALAGLVVIGALAAIGLSLRVRTLQLDPPPLVASSSVPTLQRILVEYRRLSQGELPGRARDLGAVRSAVPFPVVPLANADAHLIAAWTTDLDGEPAAVLAYRWSNHVVMQFVVAEPTVFRAAELRAAFAEGRAVVAQDANQGLVAWPEANAGDVIIGDVPWITLVPLSRARVR